MLHVDPSTFVPNSMVVERLLEQLMQLPYPMWVQLKDGQRLVGKPPSTPMVQWPMMRGWRAKPRGLLKARE